jgi:hypothetical protein
MTPALRRILLVAAAVRVVALVAIAAGWAVVPFSLPHHDANFLYPAGEEVSLTSAFKTWDANHYLYLAEQGYEPLNINNAFYPLFPALVRAASVITLGHTLIAGLLVAVLLSVAAVGLFHVLVTRTHGEEVATSASLLLLAFPTSFYLGLVYTESLFLALSAALLLLLRQNRFWAAAAVAALLPLSRPTGILMSIPAAVGLWLAWRRGDLRGPLRMAAVPAGFALGLAAYFGVMAAFTGDPLAGFDAQRVFLADNSAARLLHPVDWVLDNFVRVDLSWHGFRTSALNRLCFALFVPVAILSVRRLPPDLLACLLVLGTIPAMTGPLTSYPRYVLAAFPLFVTLALLLRSRAALWTAVAASAALELATLLVHASNRWVA